MMKRRRPLRKPLPPNAPLPPVANPELRAAILAVVDTQLRTSDPPETMQTLERLSAMGYSPEGARQLIAQAVVSEIFNVMAQGKPYDAARYLAALARLPELPDAEK
ncbi:MAG: hypothetical protein H7Y32_16805 [Chloroflexales bacterium]|nr:hypothetical protein [Chloroflexales bacterium]